jgi:Bacterial Ig-like domain
MTSFRRSLPFVLALAILLLLSTAASAATVQVLGTPFPSDIHTLPDPSQLTGVRVNLPSPDCATHPSDCADVSVLNTLDGFNLQPRISIAFTDAIDPGSVSSATIFLVSLGSTTDGGGGGKVVGINQAIWEPVANTLHVESDELLDQHTRYLLVVTRGVRGADGQPLGITDFRHDLNFGQTHDEAAKAYRKSVLDALGAAGVPPADIAGASVFTTQSATAILEKIRGQLGAATPAPASFLLGPGASRTVFALSTVTSLIFTRQTGTSPAFSATPMPLAALFVVPGAIGSVAFGTYESPNYLNGMQFIPPWGTRTGTPATFGSNTVYFNLFVPAGTKPASGWPVAIFGHGFGDNKNNSPLAVASILASRGIATIAINVVGHGFGPLGTITVGRSAANGGPVTFSAGGRGFDQDGNTTIDSTEGSSALAPLIGNRDGLRQTVSDLMQLVRVIQVGVDIDGVGGADLDANRIYYFGQSFGGIYGTKFLAIEPAVRAGVPNVPGGAIIEIARLSPVFRPLVAASLCLRVPSLINGGPGGFPGLCSGMGFTENIPLRDKPILIDTVDGASIIQRVLDDTEWVSQSGNPVAYAPHLRRAPLAGMAPKLVIIQFAKGDQTVPNPTASALIRAGDLADRTTYFRNDLLFAVNAATPKNPHTFLTNIANPIVAPLALAAQGQIADLFKLENPVLADPDGGGVFFEAPIQGELPEELNFIP